MNQRRSSAMCKNATWSRSSLLSRRRAGEEERVRFGATGRVGHRELDRSGSRRGAVEDGRERAWVVERSAARAPEHFELVAIVVDSGDFHVGRTTNRGGRRRCEEELDLRADVDDRHDLAVGVAAFEVRLVAGLTRLQPLVATDHGDRLAALITQNVVRRIAVLARLHDLVAADDGDVRARRVAGDVVGRVAVFARLLDAIPTGDRYRLAVLVAENAVGRIAVFTGLLKLIAAHGVRRHPAFAADRARSARRVWSDPGRPTAAEAAAAQVSRFTPAAAGRQRAT